MRDRILSILTIIVSGALPSVAMAGSPGTLFGDDSSAERDLLGSLSSPEDLDDSDLDDGSQAIYGGGLIDADVWPETAALADQWGVFCTGTLIAPDLVLTAAHCLEEGAPPTRVELAGGKNGGGETIGVRRVQAYPNGLNTYDVGLVFLQREAETAPRALALDCVAEDALVDGASVTLAGFGETEERIRDGHKNAVTTRIVDADCTELGDFDCVRRVSPGGELVAGGKGKDTCYGDSGGPLYLHTTQGDFLAGVTSRGATLDEDCGAGGIYVRVDAVADWIEAESGVELPRPDCSGAVAAAAPTTELVSSAASSQVGGCTENSIHSLGALLLLLPMFPFTRRRREEDR